ncbi:MAG: hypothetical protein KF799_05280 [Bdellovibrionales bacterium]|nr:hypothetical protein [Bdellovibrionales bacterium]
MTKEVRIEHYLLQLDRELQALPVGQRAEIITEIKTHIRVACEREPERELQSILADLGTAPQVAERFLAAKGLSRTAPPASTGGLWIKWLAISTVVLFGLIFVGGIAAFYYLDPLVNIDGEKGRLSLLGGTVNFSVDEDLAGVKVGGVPVSDAFKDGEKVVGEADLSSRSLRLLRIPFNTAKIEFIAGVGRRLEWACRSTTGDRAPQVEVSAGVATLNLDQLNIARCLISLPAELTAEIRGVNGKLHVKNPASHLTIELSNGKVNIDADPTRTYDFDVHVKNGLQDFFPRSNQSDAVKVRVNVTNGLVKKK